MNDCDKVLAILRERGVTGSIEMAIVLGTGLGSVVEAIEAPLNIPYADLPGFPEPRVSGHAGQLTIGTWEGIRVAVMQGRGHQYEKGDAAVMRTPLELLAKLGARMVILTNSAGSTHIDWYPGSIVMISDHINLTGFNPLVGAEGDGRFVALNDAYDKVLRVRMRKAAANSGIQALREGVYMWFPGPSFETVAEVKAAKLLGADLVGMSTVPETILSRYLGMKVVALSVITNFASGITGTNPSHTETKSGAVSGALALRRLLRAFMRPDV